MALKATIFKAELQIADMDRNYYHDHALTIARHPSETDERMMVRLLAFALHAHEALTFANGMGIDDEPDLWQKDLTGAIDLWIDVGQPDEKRIRKACGRAKQVFIYSYGGKSVSVWREQIRGKYERAGNLTTINLPAAASQSLAKLVQRSMQFQCTIQDGQIWVADKNDTVHLDLSLQPARCVEKHFMGPSARTD
jgi:uncharacterized protein YaeQ